MSILSSGPAIVLYHLLPGALAAFIYYLFARLFIFIFRIKRPGHKFFVYFIVLYKSALILITGARYSYSTVPRKSVGFGNTLYDPFDLLPIGNNSALPDVSKTLEVVQSSWIVGIVSIVIAVVAILLLLRWASIIWFFKKLLSEKQILPKDLLDTVKTLAKVFSVKQPRIILTGGDIGPLTIGAINPTIVLPKSTIRDFSKNEIEVIIAHELAHIKRRDTLWQWVTLFLRDVLLFSPFTHITYKALQANKEIATDALVLKKMPDKRSLLTKTVMRVSEGISRENKVAELAVAKANFVDFSVIKNRLQALSKIGKKENKLALIAKISAYTGLILFLWLKVWIAIKAGNKALLLLS